MAENEQKLKCNAKDKDGGRFRWCSEEEVIFSEGEDHCCVFHAPRGEKRKTYMSEERWSTDEFNEHVHARINEFKISDTICDLSGTVFEETFELRTGSANIQTLPNIIFNSSKFQNVDFEGVKFSDVYFQEAEFKNANFKHSEFETATFHKAVFYESAWFENATFTGFAGFTSAIFNDMAHFDSVEFAYANFAEARFQELAVFSGAKFEEAFFARSRFIDDANFGFAEFKQNINFEDARFLKKARFYYATFNNAIFKKAAFMNGDFKSAKFESADFHETLFKGSADFYNARFKSVGFTKTIFQGVVDFHFAEFLGNTVFNKNIFGDEFINFRNVVIAKDIYITFQNINLSNVAFLETDISRIDFTSARPREKGGRYILYDEDMFYLEEAVGGFKNEEEKKVRTNQLEELYRAGKGQCSAKHNMFDYPLWHMSEKEMQRRRLKGTLTGYILNSYNLISGYGEEPKRAFAWLLGLILVAVITISSFGIISTDKAKESFKVEDLKDNIYKVEAIRFEHLQGHSYYLKLDQLPTTALYTLETLTYMKTPDYKPASNLTSAARIFFRLATTLQFTLFAFALRNRFRR